MHPYTPAPSLSLPPVTAEEAHQAYGISKSMLDQICTIMGLNPSDTAAYGVAAITFHHELFDLLSRADIYIPNAQGLFPTEFAQEPDAVNWHPLHQRLQDTGLEVLGLSLFEKFHRIRQMEQGTAPAGTPKPTDTAIGLLITEAVSFGGFLGLNVPSLPTLRANPKGGEHDGHAHARNGHIRGGGSS